MTRPDVVVLVLLCNCFAQTAAPQLAPDEISAAPQDSQIAGLLQKALDLQNLPNPTVSDLDKEIGYFQQILAIRNDHPIAYEGLRRAEADKKALLDARSVESKKKTQALSESEAAEKALVSNDVEGAQKHLDEAQKLDPQVVRDPIFGRVSEHVASALAQRLRARIAFMAGGAAVILVLVVGGWRYIRAPRIPFVEVLDGSGRRVKLEQEITGIGAVTSTQECRNAVVVTDPSGMVSRCHCELRLRGKSLYLVDCDSRNGTYLDGRAVPSNRLIPLRDGSMISLARMVDLRIVFERNS